MNAAPCRDGSGTHLFTIGADRCSICGWNRWPEVVDGAPMTAPEAASGRVPGVTGWEEKSPGDWRLTIGIYTLEAWESPATSCVYGVGVYNAGQRVAGDAHVYFTQGETYAAFSLRVRILAEQALRTHLTEALAALGGGR